MKSAEDGRREGSSDDGIEIERLKNIPGIFYAEMKGNGAQTGWLDVYWDLTGFITIYYN